MPLCSVLLPNRMALGSDTSVHELLLSLVERLGHEQEVGWLDALTQEMVGVVDQLMGAPTVRPICCNAMRLLLCYAFHTAAAMPTFSLTVQSGCSLVAIKWVCITYRASRLLAWWTVNLDVCHAHNVVCSGGSLKGIFARHLGSPFQQVLRLVCLSCVNFRVWRS